MSSFFFFFHEKAKGRKSPRSLNPVAIRKSLSSQRGPGARSSERRRVARVDSSIPRNPDSLPRASPRDLTDLQLPVENKGVDAKEAFGASARRDARRESEERKWTRKRTRNRMTEARKQRGREEHSDRRERSNNEPIYNALSLLRILSTLSSFLIFFHT